MMKFLSIILFLGLAALMSCTEQVEPIPYDYFKVFAGENGKGWKIRNVQLLQNGKGTQTFSLPDCQTDDLYIFYANREHTYRITEGASKCDAADPDVIAESNWQFVNAGAVLTVLIPLFADIPYPYILKEVDDTKMVLEIYFDNDQASYRINFRPASIE